MKIFFATGNAGKYKEVNAIFDNFEIDYLGNYPNFPEIIEDGETFEDNAKIKAIAVFNHFNTPVMADDSGICVEQLDGRPGVYSARYAGENCTYDDNNTKMLLELEKFPEPHNASFVCCSVYYDGKQYFTSMGELRGRIIKSKTGRSGFGYDPIFVPNGFNKTLAELTVEEKNKISHRGVSFNKLKQILVEKNIL
ncbi:MAG: RdgB/HAM1 family non-canonical purine NTP pyrophosphatase [bacterium]